MTKHRVFSGPGFALAQELGDAADGGQVLLSHDAWLNLRHSMCDAGFPQVEQLGMYKLEAWPAPLWIYQVGLYRKLCRQPCDGSTPPPKQGLWQITQAKFGQTGNTHSCTDRVTEQSNSSGSW